MAISLRCHHESCIPADPLITTRVEHKVPPGVSMTATLNHSVPRDLPLWMRVKVIAIETWSCCFSGGWFISLFQVRHFWKKFSFPYFETIFYLWQDSTTSTKQVLPQQRRSGLAVPSEMFTQINQANTWPLRLRLSFGRLHRGSAANSLSRYAPLPNAGIRSLCSFIFISVLGSKRDCARASLSNSSALKLAGDDVAIKVAIT